MLSCPSDGDADPFPRLGRPRVAAAAAAGPAWAGDSLRHDITVDARGPLAFVEITRGRCRCRTSPAPPRPCWTSPCRNRAPWSRSRSAIAAAGVRSSPPRPPRPATRTATRAQRAASRPAAEPFDDSADYRLRVQRGRSRAGRSRRRSATGSRRRRRSSNGRYRVRFPAAPERLPVPADVTVTVQETADVDIAGTRTQTAAGVVRARGPRLHARRLGDLVGAARSGSGRRRTDAGHARRDGGAVTDGDGARLLRPQPPGARRRRADQRAAGRSTARAASGCRDCRPSTTWRAGCWRRCRPARASTPCSSTASSDAAVPDEPAGHARGDRRARRPRWCRRACRTAPIWWRRCARRARCCAASRAPSRRARCCSCSPTARCRAAQDGAALDHALGAVPDARAVGGGVRRAPARRRSDQPRDAAGAQRLRGEPARHRARAARERRR